MALLRLNYLAPMKMIRLTLALIFSAVLAGCNPSAEGASARLGRTEPAHPGQEYLTAATLFVQQSAEYRALCYQAYATAKERVAAYAMNGGNSEYPPVVVLDLDETVLDNSAYTAWQIANDRAFDYETWAQWCELGEAPEVPGAGDFLRFADAQGITLYYVSNRDEAALEATMRNMKALEMPQVSREHFMLKTTTSSKTDRRNAVEELGYEIILLIGDNLGDHHERYDKTSNEERRTFVDEDREKFGATYIVLPNPLYGTWEGAIYNFDRSISDEERFELRRKALKPAEITE